MPDILPVTHPAGCHSIRTNQCPPLPSPTYFLHARCPSCHPTNSVKALQETQSTDPNQWPGLILSSSTTGLLTELCCSFCPLSNASTSSYTHTYKRTNTNTTSTFVLHLTSLVFQSYFRLDWGPKTNCLSIIGAGFLLHRCQQFIT